MSEPISRRPLPSVFLLLTAGLGCAAWSGCTSSSNKVAQSGGNTGAYASFPADGHYNPYPNAPQGTVTRYQEYTEAPPPPAPEEEPKPKPKPSATTAARTTASTSPARTTTKKKSTTAATASKPSPKVASKAAPAKSAGSGTVYVVKPKDSLWSISRKYHTTISKLKSANGLSSDLIRDGQKLKIP